MNFRAIMPQSCPFVCCGTDSATTTSHSAEFDWILPNLAYIAVSLHAHGKKITHFRSILPLHLSYTQSSTNHILPPFLHLSQPCTPPNVSSLYLQSRRVNYYPPLFWALQRVSTNYVSNHRLHWFYMFRWVHPWLHEILLSFQ